MAKETIHLTITEKYADRWGTWEGVREFIQNWYDGVLDSFEGVSPPAKGRRSLTIVQRENGTYEAKLNYGDEEIPLGTLMYEKDSKCLTMINHNTELLTKVLLLGYSSKKGHRDIIGQFGEGLKIGTLALLRTSHKVLIATKNGTWNFFIEAHPKLGESVLTVTIEANTAGGTLPNLTSSVKFDEGDTVSQICPIEEEEWNGWIKRFLFLEQPKEYAETEKGSLLFDEHLQSQLYVKQIWVQDRRQNKDLMVGVNFKELQIDRDRQAILYQSEIDHSVSDMWSSALSRNPELASRYYKLLEKSDHTADVRMATMHLGVKEAKMLAEVFLRLYGENAIPVPNSSAAERLSYLNKELQENIILINQNLIDILKKSGMVRMVEDVLNQQRPDTGYTRRLFKDIPQDQLIVLTEAEQFVKMVNPDFSTSNIEFHDGRDQIVTRVGENQFEVPQWMLCSEYVHQQIACPAETPEACFCASAFLCERILSALGPYDKDAGDRKIQEFVLTLALQAKGKRPKRQPILASVDEVLKKNEEELCGRINQLSESLREQQKKHEASLEEMRQKLTQFQSELANEDIRFLDREQDLIKQQKEERESMREKVEKYQVAHEKELQEQKEDYFRITGDLEAERRKKSEVESQMEGYKDKHRNELTLKNQESIKYRKRLATSVDQLSHVHVQVLAKKTSLPTDLSRKLEEIKKLMEEELHDSDRCVICMTSKKDCSLKPCGHQFCALCCESGLRFCPVCFQEVKDKHKL